MNSSTTGRSEPRVDWSDLVDDVRGPQRDAVMSALQHSASTGWPASRETARALVDYAQGRISSQEYAVQILVALGYADAHTAGALIAQRSQRPATPAAFQDNQWCHCH